MNERIIKLGLDSGILNYVDNETPRRYFLSGHADEECLEKFAELIVLECTKVSVRAGALNEVAYEGEMIADAIHEHFRS